MARQFTSNVQPLDHNQPVTFEKTLIKHHIKHNTHIRVKHSQTNGKLEKLWDIFERKVIHFKTVDEFMHWYNHIRPHGALNLDEIETLADAYYSKLQMKCR